jgi:hypothetical protein
VHLIADLAAAVFGLRPGRPDHSGRPAVPRPYPPRGWEAAAGDAGRPTVIALVTHPARRDAASPRARPLGARARVLAETSDDAGSR